MTTRLTRGLTTTSAGGGGGLPSLLHRGASALTASGGPAKRAGRPRAHLALGLVFASSCGSTAGRRAGDTVRRADCGWRAGLPVLPSPAPQYRFRQDVPGQDSLAWPTALGHRLVARGQGTPGQPVHVDAHHSPTASRKAMQYSCLAQEARSGQARRPCSTHDQQAKQPRSARAPSSGTTVSHVTRRLARLTRALLGRDGLMVAAKAWDGGQLLQERHPPCGVTVLPPGTSAPQRLAADDAVPLDQDERTVWGNVAAVSTPMTPFAGPVRVRLKHRRHGPSCALITPAGAMPADTARPTSPTRWRIETGFAENAC